MSLMMQIIRTWLCLCLLSPLAMAGGEYVTYLHPDVQGSPVVATNEQGQVIWRESYAPWGEREIKDTASANPALGSKTWYTGKEEEEALGLYYYGARWYSPNIGQFYSIDPAPVTLDDPRSFGRYHYANNNPIRYIDPDGRLPVVALGLGLLIIVKTAHAPGTNDNPVADNGVAQFFDAIPAGKAIKGYKAVERTASGKRVGDFTAADKKAAKSANAEANGGQMRCADCDKPLESIPSQRGVKTPDNQAQIHHHPAVKDGGGRHSEAIVLCPPCHIGRHQNEK